MTRIDPASHSAADTDAPAAATGPGPAWPALGVLVAGVLVAYGNSFEGAFVLDDLPSIVENSSIRSGGTAWFPPEGGLTVSGRPLLNATFALNHAISGSATWSYHGLNLLIHLLAALTLWGVLRRTFRLPSLTLSRARVDWFAVAIALLWAVHPLQTESVTYLVQRAESLGGLWLLLAVYGFLRGMQSPNPRLWFTAAVAACLAGAATKETAAVAPLIVLLYDRAFFAGSLRSAWRARGWFYLQLASTWIVTAWLVLENQGRGGTVGAGGPVQWWEYAALQLAAIPHYVRLAVWPHPLVFDYGPFQSISWSAVAPGAALTLPAIAAALWALRRNRPAGFLGASFFLLLAPSSSVVPIASQVMAEHRMYLPLACLIAGLVLVLRFRGGQRGTLAACIVATAALIWCTWQRNRVYRSPLQLWEQTVADRPENPRAWVNLGEALAGAGRLREAIESFRQALRLQPNYTTAHYDLGTVHLRLGEPALAIEPLRAALENNPEHAEAAYNLGNALAATREPAGAARWYARALEISPGQAKVHYNLANTLVSLGRRSEAIAQYDAALLLDPGSVDALFNRANALLESGRTAEAIQGYEAVLRLDPGDRDAAANLAVARRQAAGKRP